MDALTEFKNLHDKIKDLNKLGVFMVIIELKWPVKIFHIYIRSFFNCSHVESL